MSIASTNLSSSLSWAKLYSLFNLLNDILSLKRDELLLYKFLLSGIEKHFLKKMYVAAEDPAEG